jgi:hypothetical protein
VNARTNAAASRQQVERFPFPVPRKPFYDIEKQSSDKRE